MTLQAPACNAASAAAISNRPAIRSVSPVMLDRRIRVPIPAIMSAAERHFMANAGP